MSEPPRQNNAAGDVSANTGPSVAPDQSGQPRRRVPGRNGGTLTPWRKGESGNIRGLPPPPLKLRLQWRAMADELARQITANDGIDGFKLASLVHAFRALADRSGMEPDSEMMKGLAALANATTLSPEQRAAVIATWQREQTGESLPALGPGEDP